MGNIKPGVYKNVSFEEYISWPCFHKSMVSYALRSTYHLDHYIKTKEKASKEMDFGSLVDCLILEPHMFKENFSMKPETYVNKAGHTKPWTLKATYCKEWEEQKSLEGKTLYKSADLEKAVDISEQCLGHLTASQWLKDFETQVAIVWEDSETGILCKGRIDILQKDRISDLKTTHNASPNEFRRTVNNFLYHVQDYMYTTGYEILTGEKLPFGFLVVESDSPHCVATYELGVESRVTAEHLFRRAIHRYKDYLEMGPTGYSNFKEEIEIPAWAVNLVEEDLNV